MFLFRIRAKFTLLTVVFLSLALASAGYAQCQPSQKIRPAEARYGGSGGGDFDDLQDALTGGPITKIEVWHGKLVDGIRVTYGNLTAQVHGIDGNPMNVSTSQLLLSSGEYITQITGRSGVYLDRICFSTNLKPAGQCFGGNGGNEFQVSNPSGLPLRSISGRSGKYVDAIGFSFGNFSEIQNITWDKSILDQAINNPTPKSTVTQDLDNATATTQNVSYTQSSLLQHSEQISWGKQETSTITHAPSIHVNVTSEYVNGGISYGVTLSKTTSTTEGYMKTISESQQMGWTVPVSVPPRSRIRATSTWYETTLNVPMTYDVVFKSADNSVICTEHRQAALTGVASYGLRHTFENPTTKAVQVVNNE